MSTSMSDGCSYKQKVVLFGVILAALNYTCSCSASCSLGSDPSYGNTCLAIMIVLLARAINIQVLACSSVDWMELDSRDRTSKAIN